MIAILGVIVIASIGFVYYQKTKIKVVIPKAININTANQPTMGKKTAKIHLIAFEDLKCTNCARFNNNLFPYIKKNYIDTGIATYTMINLAFINGSLPAATAARCIYHQNEKLFFPFVKYVYENQPPENEDWANIPKLLDFANNIPGVNTNALSNCLLQSPYEGLIANNMKIAEKAMKGEVATPTIYINGIIVRPLTQERFDTIMNLVKQQ